MIEFRLLGPVEMWVDGHRLEAGQPRQRTVLAALAADAGRVVTTDTLIDRLWGDTPPATARRSLHAHVTRVRRVLDEVGDQVALRRRAGGYLLDAAPELVDLHRMRGLLDRGRRSPTERVALLREAVALWRGEPLTGIAGPWADRMRQSWRQERLDLMLAWSRAELAAGNPGEVIRRLSELTGDYPLAEPLSTELIRALHAAGRSAEALERYAAIRRRLGEELGVDPGPELQALYRTLLGAPSPPTDVVPAPAQLPASVAGFAGRGAALAELDDLLAASLTAGGAAVIAAISGPAGVGKTSLAVHWAHKAAARFPDGCLYVNLRGFDTGGQMLDPGEAVRGFLYALGVPPDRVPSTSEAQAGLYRSLLAGRRLLVLLDNARDADHVRPLLPASPAALTLVTSRNQLTPLLATHGAHPVDLAALPAAEARELLARRLGPGPMAAEPDAAAAIIAACAGLPLALAIAAARARQNDLPLTALAGELAGARIGALDAGDTSTRVETVFSWSYAALSPSAARLFRLLAPLPGPDVSAVAAASAAGRPLPEVRRDLAELVQASMLLEPAPGRHTFHDLLRAYATGLAPDGDRDATARLLNHYLHTAYAANMLLDPAQDPIALDGPVPGVTLDPPAKYQEAMDWFAAERLSLLAALKVPGFDTVTWQLCLSMVTFLDWQGYWHDLEAAARLAVGAAARSSDAVALARAHRHLSIAHLGLNRFAEGEAELRTALDISTASGDVIGQAFAHNGLASLHDRRDRADLALPHARRSLELFESAGHRVGQANALNSVGWYQALLGDHEDSLTSCRRALALLEELGDRYGQAHTWDSLGYAAHHLGRHPDAVDCYRNAVAIFHDLGDRYQEADTTTKLGDTHQTAGDLPAARAAWEHACRILTDLNHPDAAALRAKLGG
ncbi:AfsR/SARP family transcriptional regulator [Paractinoplanes atraurantiacus]|uniref:DNA-binding transcriptional activator of the SARP family n=1 Tax=Paractinoplanes atraurantiacus TaxID=1036182 RepID=A0A285KBV8_9ACTN|nr:BTAD domain-containing putative transcriptional regulator [Actinoplanes atraurantiacus]SNY70109.1 DNA-binding transcriptional activator of the SARP family [Actinoplanes atraurantiacus]